MDCVFCQIAAGEVPARIVCQDDDAMVLIPLKLNTKAHVIVVPKEHSESLFDIPSDTLSGLVLRVQKTAVALRDGLGADGVNVLHATGKAAQQSVGHLHFHILPRWDNDGLDAWPRLPEWEGDLDELLTELKDITGT